MSKKTPRKPRTAAGGAAALIEQSPPRRRWLTAAAAAIIVAAGVAAYCNSLHNPFIFDDGQAITENTTIRRLWPPWEILSPPPETTATDRPVLNLTFAVNYAIHGLSAFGFHVTNLAIHLTAALLLLGVLRRTIGRTSLRPVATELAAVATLLWTLHPLQTESVTYIVQRAESLVGMLYLLTMYCAVRGFDSFDSPRGRWWLAAAVAACAVGMGAKEVMVTAPVAVLLYDRTFISPSWRAVFARRRWLFYAGLAATWAVLLTVLAHSAKNAMGNFGLSKEWWRYTATQPEVILYYIGLSFWPRRLCLDYWWQEEAVAWKIVATSVPILLLAGLSLWGLRRGRWWGYAGAWFFLVLLPTSSVVAIADAAFEHRMYLPMAAMAALATVGGYLLARRLAGGKAVAVAMALAVAAAAALGYRTHLRNIDYQTELGMWRDVLAQRPSNPRAYSSIGKCFMDTGDYQQALKYYDKALELRPGYAAVYLNYGSIMGLTGHRDKAIANYTLAITHRPDFLLAYCNRGKAYIDGGMIQEGIADLDKAVSLRPNYVPPYYTRGAAYQSLGQYENAINDYTRAVELTRGSAEAYSNRGICHGMFKRQAEAISDFGRAIAADPRYPHSYGNRAVTYLAMAKPDLALADLNKAIGLEPNYAKFYANRAVAWYSLNDYKKAWADVDQCRRLGGSLPPAFLQQLSTVQPR